MDKSDFIRIKSFSDLHFEQNPLIEEYMKLLDPDKKVAMLASRRVGKSMFSKIIADAFANFGSPPKVFIDNDKIVEKQLLSAAVDTFKSDDASNHANITAEYLENVSSTLFSQEDEFRIKFINEMRGSINFVGIDEADFSNFFEATEKKADGRIVKKRRRIY